MYNLVIIARLLERFLFVCQQRMTLFQTVWHCLLFQTFQTSTLLWMEEILLVSLIKSASICEWQKRGIITFCLVFYSHISPFIHIFNLNYTQKKNSLYVDFKELFPAQFYTFALTEADGRRLYAASLIVSNTQLEIGLTQISPQLLVHFFNFFWSRNICISHAIATLLHCFI